MDIIRRFWKVILATTVLLLAGTITFVWPKNNGLDIDIDSSPRAQAAKNSEPYDLSRLRVLNRTILEVKDHYVDPDRIRPKKMLLAGLNALQRAVAPVLVHFKENENRVIVRVDTKSRGFNIAEVRSPWALTNKFRDIFAFVQKHLREDDLDLRDVEYAVVNGVLRTLDPHSVLLTPDVFEEMQMSTRGKFGGLGIVISIRDGHLTIIRPMPGTPAAKAKLQRGDKIVKINSESTLNMPLSEAVDRLRGDPGSSVSIWIRRNGNKGKPKRVNLVRAVISIDSVESKMLSGRVGYMKVRSFQGNTYRDIRKDLEKLRAQKMKGLVLDLRENPGGLLDQAVRIADTFLESGTIVTTSSNDPDERDEKYATKKGTEPSYPIVVLINGSSASASEIVAGALKNHDRAVVIGQRSFGKGSVQVLYNFQDQSALKLTIAHYLTPGDVSIQGVGIVPDIGIDPMTVDKEDMDLAVDAESYLRESDLREHLTHTRVSLAEKPKVAIRYYLSSEARQRLQEAAPEEREENEQENEFLTRFAKAIISGVTKPNRRQMLKEISPVIRKFQDDEMGSAVAALKKLGVDWSKGSNDGKANVEVVATTSTKASKANNKKKEAGSATAGEPFELKVSVKNNGTSTLYQLRATTESDYGLFNDRELVFGKLAPGETREWTTTLGVCAKEEGAKQRTCKLPPYLSDRADGVKIKFKEAYNRLPEPVEIRTTVRSLPRPQFSYAVNVTDEIEGNKNGILERGERGAMHVLIRNVGEGKTRDLQANLRNLSGQGLLLQDGRFDLEPLGAGEERWVRFTFRVAKEFRGKRAKFEILVSDLELRESLSEKLNIPVSKGGTSVTKVGKNMLLKDKAVLRSSPSKKSETIAKVEGGTFSARIEAKAGEFYRIAMNRGGTAWVHNGFVTKASSKRGGKTCLRVQPCSPTH